MKKPIDIPWQPLAHALRRLVTERDMQLIYSSALIESRQSHGASGELTSIEVLARLLGDTGLTWRYLDEKTVTIEPAPSAPPRTQEEESTKEREDRDAPDAGTPDGTPQVLVRGASSLNADIERTRDDIQPYDVLNRKMIEQSGASSVNELLRSRLTMNYVRSTSLQDSTGTVGVGNESSIALRGLTSRRRSS